MTEYLRFANEIITEFWNSTTLQWLFYAALILIALKEKEVRTKHLLFWYPVIVFLILLSPPAILIESRVWGTENIHYFCRQFSLVPIFYVIAYAGTIIVKRYTGKKKLVLVLALSMLICFCGSGLIYKDQTYGFEKSENAYKLSSDLITMCDYMSSVDDTPVVAMTTNLAYQARQYNPNLYLMVNIRDESVLSNELNSDSPNVSTILEEMASHEGEFFILKNTDDIKKKLSETGYEPSLETNNYLLYTYK